MTGFSVHETGGFVKSACIADIVHDKFGRALLFAVRCLMLL